MKIIFTIFAFTISVFATNLSEQTTTLSNVNVDKKEATISIGKLSIGQSGIIVNTDAKENKIIICYATIVSSENDSSLVKFNFKEIIEQHAMPTTKLLPKNGDTFVLNHLYKNSMIIAPNFKALSETKKLYPNINFLDTDLFGAYLKINNTPAPTKEDILTFAHKNDLGSIFVIVNDKINIVDSVSFAVVDSIPLTNDDKTSSSPFHTNVEDIKVSTFSFFELKSIGEYHSYYKKLLGLKDGK